MGSGQSDAVQDMIHGSAPHNTEQAGPKCHIENPSLEEGQLHGGGGSLVLGTLRVRGFLLGGLKIRESLMIPALLPAHWL